MVSSINVQIKAFSQMRESIDKGAQGKIVLNKATNEYRFIQFREEVPKNYRELSLIEILTSSHSLLEEQKLNFEEKRTLEAFITKISSSSQNVVSMGETIEKISIGLQKTKNNFLNPLRNLFCNVNDESREWLSLAAKALDEVVIKFEDLRGPISNGILSERDQRLLNDLEMKIVKFSENGKFLITCEKARESLVRIRQKLLTEMIIHFASYDSDKLDEFNSLLKTIQMSEFIFELQDAEKVSQAIELLPQLERSLHKFYSAEKSSELIQMIQIKLERSLESHSKAECNRDLFLPLTWLVDVDNEPDVWGTLLKLANDALISRCPIVLSQNILIRSRLKKHQLLNINSCEALDQYRIFKQEIPDFESQILLFFPKEFIKNINEPMVDLDNFGIDSRFLKEVTLQEVDQPSNVDVTLDCFHALFKKESKVPKHLFAAGHGNLNKIASIDTRLIPETIKQMEKNGVKSINWFSCYAGGVASQSFLTTARENLYQNVSSTIELTIHSLGDYLTTTGETEENWNLRKLLEWQHERFQKGKGKTIKAVKARNRAELGMFKVNYENSAKILFPAFKDSPAGFRTFNSLGIHEYSLTMVEMRMHQFSHDFPPKKVSRANLKINIPKGGGIIELYPLVVEDSLQISNTNCAFISQISGNACHHIKSIRFVEGHLENFISDFRKILSDTEASSNKMFMIDHLVTKSGVYENVIILPESSAVSCLGKGTKGHFFLCREKSNKSTLRTSINSDQYQSFLLYNLFRAIPDAKTVLFATAGMQSIKDLIAAISGKFISKRTVELFLQYQENLRKNALTLANFPDLQDDEKFFLLSLAMADERSEFVVQLVNEKSFNFFYLSGKFREINIQKPLLLDLLQDNEECLKSAIVTGKKSKIKFFLNKREDSFEFSEHPIVIALEEGSQETINYILKKLEKQLHSMDEDSQNRIFRLAIERGLTEIFLGLDLDLSKETLVYAIKHAVDVDDEKLPNRILEMVRNSGGKIFLKEILPLVSEIKNLDFSRIGWSTDDEIGYNLSFPQLTSLTLDEQMGRETVIKLIEAAGNSLKSLDLNLNKKLTRKGILRSCQTKQFKKLKLGSINGFIAKELIRHSNTTLEKIKLKTANDEIFEELGRLPCLESLAIFSTETTGKELLKIASMRTAGMLASYGALQAGYTRVYETSIHSIPNNTISGSMAGFTTLFGLEAWNNRQPSHQISRAVLKEMFESGKYVGIKYGVLPGALLGTFIGLVRFKN